MTTVSVLADTPDSDRALPRLADTSPLSAPEAADCYAAMLRDVCSAVEASGGDLLVNYRDGAEAAVRAAVAGALDVEETRFEVQVGETFAGRAGNTVAHLLREEGADSVAVVEPTAAFLGRSQVDSAAMKLRRSEVVLGPGDAGRVYYAGFTDEIDFENAYATPAVETLTDRARDAGHEVDFLPVLPVVETGRDLASAVSLVRARERAGRIVPEHFAGFVDDLGLVAVDADGGLALRRG